MGYDKDFTKDKKALHVQLGNNSQGTVTSQLSNN